MWSIPMIKLAQHVETKMHKRQLEVRKASATRASASGSASRASTAGGTLRASAAGSASNTSTLNASASHTSNLNTDTSNASTSNASGFADHDHLGVLAADCENPEVIAADIGTDSTDEAPSQEWDFELHEDLCDCDSGMYHDSLHILKTNRLNYRLGR